MIVIWVLIIFKGCNSKQNVVILRDINYSRDLSETFEFNTVIRKDDKLTIVVSCAEPELSAPYNAPMMGVISPSGSGGGNTQQSVTPGYIVDRNGYIDFPTLGRIYVEGMRRDELVDLLRDKLARQINDPTITIMFSNFRITMLGAVKEPGEKIIKTERISILDAIGLAGDFEMKSRRRDVLVVRDNGGSISHGRLDLNSASIFQSDYYYLQQNDIVYVEPTRGNVRDGSASSFLPYTLGIMTSILSLTLIFMYFN